MNAIAFLQKYEIIPHQMKCPGPYINDVRQGNCGKQMVLKQVGDRKDGLSWRCRKVHKVQLNNRIYTKKDVKVSIRDNTWIQKCKLTIEEIILMLYCWSNNYTNEQIQHEVRCSQKTVTAWCSFLRDSCISKMLDYSEPIGGPGIDIEIDESKFGRRKYYKGHQVKGQWIFGGRESKDKSKIFMVPVHNRKKETLEHLIKKYIKPGSIIHSDCWKAYDNLKDMGYKHITVNHSKHFTDPHTGACTNRIESDWRHAKVSMPRYGVKEGDHVSYLAEFLWRRKHHDLDLFIEIIKDLNMHYNNKYFMSSP